MGAASSSHSAITAASSASKLKDRANRAVSGTQNSLSRYEIPDIWLIASSPGNHIASSGYCAGANLCSGGSNRSRSQVANLLRDVSPFRNISIESIEFQKARRECFNPQLAHLAIRLRIPTKLLSAQ